MAKQYWLMKSEPAVFSFDDLRQSAAQTTFWDGVRNYKARNYLRDSIAVGDEVLFYHSREEPMAAVGVAKVVEAGTPDPTQFDRKSKYYDGESPPDAPRWYGVRIKYQRAFRTPVTLRAMRDMPELEGLMLLARGARLSVQPVAPHHFAHICAVGDSRA